MAPPLRLALRIALGGLLLAGCRGIPEARVLAGPAPPSPERFCAWFGAASGGVLYFGEAAFWDRFRAAGGDPRADLLVAGPARIGRFDLAGRRFLSPLPVAAAEPGGTWDVLPRAMGGPGGRLRIWFTTYFGPAGFVDLPQGTVRRLPEAGPGLNELAPGPDGTVVVTRYGRPDRAAPAPGSLVLLAADGRIVEEIPLEATASGLLPLPKSVAFDPGRREFWVNTDLVDGEGRARGHDARVLDDEGRERLRYAEPELQFPFFDGEGRGYLAERAGGLLWLRLLPPGDPAGPPPEGRRVLLDDDFPTGLDFVQEITRSGDGPAVVTRWSGVVHLVDPARPDAPRRVELPRPDPGGLYYSAVLHRGRLCATYCAGVRVTCVELGRPGDEPEAL